jgi:4-amino-4-deoxy-L-arabinose transferase-like glycosyltransferase
MDRLFDVFKPGSPLAMLPESVRARWIFTGLVILLCAIGNLPWHLDNYDQAKQAFVAYEIQNGGSPWFQHTPRGRTASKPPLAGWASLPVYWTTGSWDLAWRLPGFVCTLVLLGLLMREGQRLLPSAGALLAACAFGLNLLTPRIATLVRTDMMLTLWITVCGLLILRKVQTGSEWTSGERWAFFGAMTAALFTKGPILYAFLLPGMVAFAWLGPKGRKHLVWSGWWTWVIPLMLFLAWGVAGLVTNPEFYEEIVVREFFSRFDQSLKSHETRQPVWFYFPHLIHKFLPWSLLLIALPFFSKNVRKAVRENPAVLWLACWALGGLVLMTFVPSKRVDRIFPVIPPLCLLIVGMVSAFPWQGRIRALCGAAMVAGALFAGSYFVGIVIMGYRDGNDALVRFGREAAAKAAQHGKGRLGIVEGRDEGLAMYAGGLWGIHPNRALRWWTEGELDALLIPERRLKDHELAHLLPEPTLVSPKMPSTDKYLLFLRTPDSASQKVAPAQ